MSTAVKVPISALPLPPTSHTLTQNLTPDPHTPSPSAFRTVQKEKPSIQRRGRILDPPSHFSFVSPLPIAFPYKIIQEEGETESQSSQIERYLSERESLHEKSNAPTPTPGVLKKYYPEEGKRDQPLELIGLSETGLRDCIPHLNVGDGFDILGSPTLTCASKDEEQQPQASEEDIAVRKELVEVLSGHASFMNVEEGSSSPWAPWSLRYSGHQFGTWAGQLGDGRAISILATPHLENPDELVELQLKGGGRTPFSRGADGLAVVRSSIREFLCAEAMHALSIPTTRSLSLISLPGTPVLREQEEAACVLTRMAPSFIRLGSFEALNPPANMFFFGGGQQAADMEALRKLGEWVGQRVLRLEGVRWGEKGDPWGKKLVLEVAKRNAKMVAGWQAYGFMHGVINTDNVSILGLTIDYGPYAFMDVFDQFHICNHSDAEGRYSYKAQPSMIVYALRSLLNSLAPVIGAEIESGAAVSSGWAEGASKEKIGEWSQKALEHTKEEMEILIQEASGAEYGRIMHRRLGLRRIDKEDEGNLSRPLLNLMGDHRLDFHSTFRRLAYFRPSMIQPENKETLETYISGILALTPEPNLLERDRAVGEWKNWLKVYGDRIESERNEWVKGSAEGVDVDSAREKEAKEANPRFILRQWVLEEVIKAVEKDAGSGKRILRKVLQMACKPFDPWGAEDTSDAAELDEETKEERRFCGIGERKMLGFQCSCSS